MRLTTISKVTFIMVFSFVTSGCATPYQDMVLGQGVVAAPMGGDTYRISASVNTLNRPGDLEDFLLLRSAETARDAGLAGFVIMSQRDETRSTTAIVAGTINSTATVIGGTAFATTTVLPAQQVVNSQPGASIMIRLSNNPKEAGFFASAQLLSAIGPRVARGYGRCDGKESANASAILTGHC